MKRIIKIFTVLVTLTLVFFACMTISHAEGETLTPAEENANTEAQETDTGNAEVTEPSDGTGTEDKFVFTDFFQNKILPLLTNSTVLSIVSVVIYILCNRGKKALTLENKELLGQYNKLLQMNEEQKEAVATLGEWTKSVVLAVKDTVLNELKLDPKAYAALQANIAELAAKTDTIIRAATIAWGQSPAAREALSACATGNALAKSEEKCKQYEDIIRQMKGDEADEIIAGVCEEV